MRIGPQIGKGLILIACLMGLGLSAISTAAAAQPRDCFERVIPVAVTPSEQTSKDQTSSQTSSYWLWTCADKALPTGSRYALQPLLIANQKMLWVVDPGPTAQIGALLARDMASRWPSYSVAIANSRAQPEGVLGTDGFIKQWQRLHPKRSAASVPVYAGAITAALMKKRCPACLKRLTSELGKKSLQGTRILVPNHILLDGQALPFSAAFTVGLTHDAAIEEDLTLTNPQAGLMWVGALVHPVHIPDLQQGKLEQRLIVLDHMRDFKGVVVSQFGVVSPEQIERSYRYLQTLKDKALEQLDAGADAVTSFKTITKASVWHTPLTGDQAQINELNVQRVIRDIEEHAFN